MYILTAFSKDAGISHTYDKVHQGVSAVPHALVKEVSHGSVMKAGEMRRGWLCNGSLQRSAALGGGCLEREAAFPPPLCTE